MQNADPTAFHFFIQHKIGTVIYTTVAVFSRSHYLYVCVCVCVYMCMRMCMYVCVCTCICVYVGVSVCGCTSLFDSSPTTNFRGNSRVEKTLACCQIDRYRCIPSTLHFDLFAGKFSFDPMLNLADSLSVPFLLQNFHFPKLRFYPSVQHPCCIPYSFCMPFL